ENNEWCETISGAMGKWEAVTLKHDGLWPESLARWS
ncbi:unnamed protein product, partial [marine sediment metagenome]